MSRTWTNGLMEYWIVDTEERYSSINFAVKRSFADIPIFHLPKTHYSIIPVFSRIAG